MAPSECPPPPSQKTFDFYTTIGNKPVKPGDQAFQNALISASNFQLQTDRAAFVKQWGWVTKNNQQQDMLNLLAVTPAAYSTPAERIANPGGQHVLDAIAFLFQDAEGTHLPNGIGRYRPIMKDGKITTTFCNIFVSDITRLLHCEIPNYPIPPHRHVRSMLYWLEEPTCGVAEGWRKTSDSVEAQNWATSGFVAVMAHLRSDGKRSEHIGLVRPLSAPVAHSGPRYYYPRIAQAGQIVSDDLDSGEVKSFGGYPIRELVYFLHD